MKNRKHILSDFFALMFVGLMLLTIVHVYFECHNDTSNQTNHHCVLCHQVMIEPTSFGDIGVIVMLFDPIQQILINREYIYVLKNEIIWNLFSRGPP